MLGSFYDETWRFPRRYSICNFWQDFQLGHQQKKKKRNGFWLKGFVLFNDFSLPLVKFLRFQCAAFSLRLFLYTLLSMEIFVPARPSDIVLLSCNSCVTPRSFRDSQSFDSDLTPLLFLLTSTYSLVEPNNNIHHKAPQARSGPDPSHKAKPTLST